MSKEIQAIVGEVRRIRDARAKLDDEEKVLWNRFFEICDDVAGAGQSYRYVDPQLELYIAREMHQAAPKLNVEEFKKTLTPEEWKLCSKVERVLDLEKLETAVAGGQIYGEIVERFTEYYEPVPHKKFGAATKKDINDA